MIDVVEDSDECQRQRNERQWVERARVLEDGGRKRREEGKEQRREKDGNLWIRQV